jgi:hypothetical protein
VRASDTYRLNVHVGEAPYQRPHGFDVIVHPLKEDTLVADNYALFEQVVCRGFRDPSYLVRMVDVSVQADLLSQLSP